MAEQENFCPTCHSRIGDQTTRQQGAEGIDQDSNPIPRWTGDSVLTRNGFSGPEFIGQQRTGILAVFEELQEDRIALEEEAGFTEEQKTKFSELSKQHIRNTHLIELRESTEKLLENNGSTLEEYFKTDADGNEALEPGPNDTFKSEWTDAERGRLYIHKDGTKSGTFTLPSGVEKDSPSIPANTRVRAIHIEDLRRRLLKTWREFWSVSTVDRSLSLAGDVIEPIPGFSLQAVKTRPPLTRVEGEDTISPTNGEGDIHPSDAGTIWLADTILINEPIIPPPDPNTDPPEQFYNGERTWLSKELVLVGSGNNRSAFQRDPEGPVINGTINTKTISDISIQLELGSTVDNAPINAKKLIINTESQGFTSATPQDTPEFTSVPALSFGSAIVVLYHRWQRSNFNRLDISFKNFPVVSKEEIFKINANTRFRGILTAEMSDTFTANPSLQDGEFIPGIGLPQPLQPRFNNRITLEVGLLIDNTPANLIISLAEVEVTETPPPFFNSPIIDENTVSRFNLAPGLADIEYLREFGGGTFTIDINIDKLLAKNPQFGYIPQLLEDGNPNPLASTVTFMDIQIGVISQAEALINTEGFLFPLIKGTFDSHAITNLTIDGLRIDNTPKS